MKPDEILINMGDTFRGRNEIYKDNYITIGDALVKFFPDGIILKTESDFRKFNIVNTIVGKLQRFVNSGLNHVDSIHDIGVYAAILESLINEQKSL